MESVDEVAYARCDKLACKWSSWQVYADDCLELYLREGNASDMTGAIEIAEFLMPDVRRVVVISGLVPDIAYIKIKGKWIPGCLRNNARNKITVATLISEAGAVNGEANIQVYFKGKSIGYICFASARDFGHKFAVTVVEA